MWKSKRSGGLGFRDLEAFIMALLAKQLWRLLENPNSLIGRIFKSRYFPSSDVLTATLGSSHSFTWRCILGSKHILEVGLKWRVGNGGSILVWKDRWLPNEPTLKPITPRGNSSIDMRVSDLILTGTKQWNESLISDTFVEEDRQNILSIPLGQVWNKDKLVWHYTKNGRYSVRNAYHIASRLKAEHVNPASSSSSGDAENIWKWIWSLNLPNKIKIFIWRLCKNLLPTRANLKRRRIVFDDMCGRCGNEVEDLCHCLVMCSFARQVWALSNIPLLTYQWHGHDVIDWFSHMKKMTDSMGFEKCIVVCWAIWFYRNKLVFDGELVEAMVVSAFAQHFEAQLRHPLAKVLTTNTMKTKIYTKCQPPNQEVIKVNFDASVNSRNHKGECVAWDFIHLQQPLDPTSAEAEGDSALVINAIVGGEDDISTYGNLIADILVTTTSFEFFSAQHVRKEGNRAAHEIARTSLNNLIFSTSLPHEVQTIVTVESNS